MSSKARGNLALPDIAAHRRLCDLDRRQLPPQAHPYPVRGVTLLAPRLAVNLQNLVDRAVLQLLYTEANAAEWIFPQEKSTLFDLCKGISIEEPL
jgi:hypothetical protein